MVRVSPATVFAVAFILVVLTHRAPPAASATASVRVGDRLQLSLDLGEAFLLLSAACGLFESVVIATSFHHMGCTGAVVFAGFAVDALALVAAVIHTLRPSGSLERFVA